MSQLLPTRAREILEQGSKATILVVGDVMLDSFVSGSVSRISPEAPVPVLRFESESLMPGGAANVARNLTALGAPTSLFSLVGRDHEGKQLKKLLEKEKVNCKGLKPAPKRTTGTKTRIVAQQQQIVRVDRETVAELTQSEQSILEKALAPALDRASAIIIGDYAKGMITDSFLAFLKKQALKRGIWLSLDPKPIHQVDLSGFSLITPNRKEAFQLAEVDDVTRHQNPLEDKNLRLTANRLLRRLRPALLMITLGDQGMLLCQKGSRPVHIPTVAQEVFDVSGAGDTVIASFTLAIAAGASPQEAALFSNYAGGIVVGKQGTATVTKKELLASLETSL
jgi:D-glycero-beta-D-manno-heptose-7-phosphate kinase